MSSMGMADPGAQATAALLSGAEGMSHFRTGNFDEACRALSEAVPAAVAAGCEEQRIRWLSTLALAEACRGHLTRGKELADTVQRLAGNCPVPSGDPTAAAGLASAWVALERQDLARAQRSLGRAGRTQPIYDDAWLRAVSVLLRVRLLRDRGDTGGARCLLEGRERGLGWVEGLLDVEAVDTGLPRLAGGPDPVDRACVTTADRVRDLLDRAQLSCESGDLRRAGSDVMRALSIAEVERIRRPFAHLPAQLRAVIRADRALQSRAHWLRPEQARFAGRPTEPNEDTAPVLEALSERESEVLRHLSELLTTEEIAAEMFISVNTVKTHVRRILGKLSVSRRNEAVRRARELNLV